MASKERYYNLTDEKLDKFRKDLPDLNYLYNQARKIYSQFPWLYEIRFHKDSRLCLNKEGNPKKYPITLYFFTNPRDYSSLRDNVHGEIHYTADYIMSKGRVNFWKGPNLYAFTFKRFKDVLVVNQIYIGGGNDGKEIKVYKFEAK